MAEETLVQTAEGAVPISEFYGVTEIAPPVPNVKTVLSPETMAEQAGYVSKPIADEVEVEASAPTYTSRDSLDTWDDQTLIKDRSFDPVVYYNESGQGTMDPAKLNRLSNIFKTKIQEGISSGGGPVGAVERTKRGFLGLVDLVKGAAEFVDRAAIRPVVGTATGAISEFLPGADQRREVISDWINQGLGELAGGLEIEATGLAEGVSTFLEKNAIKSRARRGIEFTDEDAKKLLTSWATREEQLQEVAQGRGATFNAAEWAKQQGVEFDPEAAARVAEGGALTMVPLGVGFKLVTSTGKIVLRAASRTAAMQAVKRLRQAATAETVASAALKAGPRTLEREVALGEAIGQRQAAEAAVKSTPGAATVNALGRATTAITEKLAPTQVVGGATQLAGATTEKVAAPIIELGSRALRATRPLGIPVGSLLGVPLGAAAKGIEVVGKAVKGAGAAIRAEAPGVAARRTQDIINATSDVFKGVAVGAPIDYAFAVGMSKSDAQAKEMPGIAGALGGLAGARRGAVRVVKGELVTPRSGSFKRSMPSSAYKENTALDAAHQTAMSKSSPELQNQVNFVRETAKKLGGRVYVMPDATQFKLLLDDIWRKQNQGVEVPAEILASHEQISQQNGMFSASILGPDGQPQNIAFIRDPAALAHEGLGHILERILPDEVNTEMDAHVRKSISPENWEQAGEYYVGRLLGENRATDNRSWREVIQELTGGDPDTYLAREMRAENLDVAFKNRGEAFATSPDLYRRIVQWVAKLGEKAGLPNQAVSEELGFPVSVEVMAKSEKAAQKIIESEPQQTLFRAQEARLREQAKFDKPTIEPKKPAVTEKTPANEARAIAEEAPEIPQAGGTRSPREMLGEIAEAIAQRAGVKINYLSAPGEPAAATTSNRVARREIIEAFRTMPPEARILWEKNFFPERVIRLKGGKYQILGWAPEVFAANAHKLAGWLSEHTNVASPYAIDATTKTFTPEAWQSLFTDTQQFVRNQQAGATGAGGELVVPRSVTERGFTQPAKTGGEVPIAQDRADVINMLFGFKLPETPRIQKGKLPLAIAGEEVSAATLPGRVEPPVRPRGEFTGIEAAAQDIAGRPIQEVNPFRNAVESAGNPPSLIEAVQRLNLENIKEVAIALEQPEFRGNTLTLTAGFQPKSIKEEMANLATRSQEDFKAFTDGYKSEKFGGGLTGWAFDLGASAKTAEDVATFRHAAETLSAAGKEAMAAKDFDRAMEFIGRSQAAREAFEAATGRTLDGTKEAGVPFIQKHFDPSYKPPVPPIVTELPKIAAQPAKQRKQLKFPKASSGGFKKAWVLPSGEPVQLGGTWHHEWLADNPDIAKKYKLDVPKFTGNDTEQVREGALRAGFARINYGVNNGTITVEARAKDWPRVKNTIADMVDANLGDIDNMTVTLFSDDVSKIVDSDSVRLFELDSDKDKLANMPFITKGEVRGQ